MCRIDWKWKSIALGIFLSFAVFAENSASAIEVKMTPEEYQEYLRLKNADEKKSQSDNLGDGRSELRRGMEDIVPPEERVFSPGERECQNMLPRNPGRITVTTPMTATVNFNSKSRYEGSLMLTADPRQPVNRDIGKFEAFGRRFDGVEVAVAISAPTQGVDVFRHGWKK